MTSDPAQIVVTLLAVLVVAWMFRDLLAGLLLRAVQEWRLAHGRYPDGKKRDTTQEPKNNHVSP